MFLQNIPYNTLVVIRTIIIITFLIIMFMATLKERRKWITFLYAVLGLILTIVCILIIPKEISSGINYTTSIIIGVVAAICTAMWAVIFGKNSMIIRREESGIIVD